MGLSREEDAVNNEGVREILTATDKEEKISSEGCLESLEIERIVERDEIAEPPLKQQKLAPSDNNILMDEDKLDNSKEKEPPVHRRVLNRPRSAVNGVYSMAVARPVSSMKGHTAFLTFAVRSLIT